MSACKMIEEVENNAVTIQSFPYPVFPKPNYGQQSCKYHKVYFYPKNTYIIIYLYNLFITNW